ncbi:MAG: chromosome segregation ATPase, partial [Verrucomicrobiales bacterium]
LQQRLGEGAHLASMAIPVPATLVAAVVSSTGKASASASATATGAAGALATTFGMITMNTLAKTTIGTIAGAGLAWFGVSNYTARKDLKNELKNVRASYTTVSLKDKAASAAANDYDTEILNLKGQLSDTTAERDELRSQLASLNEAVGDLSQDVVVNLGRIQDLGGNYAKLMVDAQGLVARFSNSDESISPQERQKMMKEFLEGASDITAAVPEIIGFEERPKDMSRFLQSLFQELAGIDETKAATLNPLLEKIYTEAIENEFTMKHAPQLDADQFDAWKAERDAFFAIGRAEILESLPVGNRELFEERIDDDSLWPRDLNVGRLPVVFNPAGDTAAKVYRQMEKLTRAREVAPQE